MRRLGRTVRECTCPNCGTGFIREVRAIKGKNTYCKRKCYEDHAPGNRKYTLNEHFFADITTPEQAYILGFVAADGGIGNNNLTLYIGLHPKDRDILEKIRFHLGSNAPIKQTFTKNNGQERYEMAVFYVSSMVLVKDLIALGITPRKSLTLEYPLLPKALERHYIRGLWDGDGHIGHDQFSLVGTYATTYGAQQAILAATGRTLHLYWRKGRNNQYVLEGSGRSWTALQWMYQDSTIHLQRKFMAYQRWWTRAEQNQLSLF
jgi:hypothetical protein